MSNGDPPVSGSPYIIICNGRIGVATASTDEERINAASQAAASLVSYLQTKYRAFNPADCFKISQIQHALMDHVTSEDKLSKDDVDLNIAALFVEFDALEDKYTQSSGY